jgi:hypothetical protein
MTILEPHQRPPVTKTAAGDDRRIGVEVELAGVSVADLAALIAQTLGGDVQAESLARSTVADSPFGDFRVELDARTLQDRAFLEPLEKLGVHDERVLEETWL